MMNFSGLRTALVLGAIVAAACGGRTDSSDETPPGDQPAADTGTVGAQESGADTPDAAVDLERLTGQVLVTGTAQIEFVTLQIDGGEPEWGAAPGAAPSHGRQGQRSGVTDGGYPSRRL